MCITQVTGMIDFDKCSKEDREKYKTLFAERKRELQKHLKTLNKEIERLHSSKVVVSLREVK